MAGGGGAVSLLATNSARFQGGVLGVAVNMLLLGVVVHDDGGDVANVVDDDDVVGDVAGGSLFRCGCGVPTRS